jgi:unsaturated chondroitin disaccharide hydrolase
MALKIDRKVTLASLEKKIIEMFELSARKIHAIEKSWDAEQGTPVFTVKGQYTSRGWTEWTQGFQFGASFLQFDATGERQFLDLGREKTIRYMASHVSHIGVHDHGFNNVSTYGNWWRLMNEGKAPFNQAEHDFCELALKISGAVQAARWTSAADGGGYIYSFNGPHSLFIDTMRSLRSLALAHLLGHVLMGERDARISLLDRLLTHARTTAKYAIYYGEGRDAYDVRGRTAHESIFNTNDGSFRCPNSQQGYSPFSTWTRGLGWAICGFAEQLEFLSQHAKEDLTDFRKAAVATADFYLQNCCADGIAMWDTGAPNLHRLPDDYLERPADPFNAWEPVDSSAAAIAAQGLLRLACHLENEKYLKAGLTILNTLLQEPYLSRDARHQGLLLHSVYHRPNGWDYIARGQKVPNGESSMWGDYHLRELALLVLKQKRDELHAFFYPHTHA